MGRIGRPTRFFGACRIEARIPYLTGHIAPIQQVVDTNTARPIGISHPETSVGSNVEAKVGRQTAVVQGRTMVKPRRLACDWVRKAIPGIGNGDRISTAPIDRKSHMPLLRYSRNNESGSPWNVKSCRSEGSRLISNNTVFRSHSSQGKEKGPLT